MLELDLARTLLDVGLLVDAAEAAQRSVRLARDGANQMLDAQGELVLAEAVQEIGLVLGAILAAQQVEAVRALLDEFGDVKLTVVVDANQAKRLRVGQWVRINDGVEFLEE